MAGIRTGDSYALELLYDRYAGRIYQRGLRMFQSPEVAEEIVQEVFWRVWKHSDNFMSERGHVSQWLSGIAKNVCIDELRKRRTHALAVFESTTHDLLMAQIDHRSDIPATVWMIEQRRLISEALQLLPLLQRQAIIAAYFHGQTSQQIAIQSDRPLGTIKTRIRLGLRKLSHLLVTLTPQA